MFVQCSRSHLVSSNISFNFFAKSLLISTLSKTFMPFCQQSLESANMRFDKLLDKFNVEPEEYGTLPGKSTSK